MNFFSDAKQDEFVANIFNFTKNGFFVDIGSHNPVQSNNSYALEKLGWHGICIEIEDRFNEMYRDRINSSLLNADATKVDYSKLFKDLNVPQQIDYLSLDIDAQSIDVLKILPHHDYKFKVITIEHDAYLYGNKYRKPQRKLLQELGYILICKDVFVEQANFTRKKCPFEDWWVQAEAFSFDTTERLKSKRLYPSEIIGKFHE